MVAALGLSACSSDPGPRRVAQDIIESEAHENPELDEECLLAELKKYSDEQLEDIANGLDSTNEETRAASQAALQAYQISLASCL